MGLKMDHGAGSLARKEYFNESAEHWDEKHCTVEQNALIEKIIGKFGLKTGQNILDAGSGTGVLIPLLIRIIGPEGSITAVDYSENMIKVFRQKFSNLRNVTSEVGDIETLNLPPEMFDAAICFGVFPHLEHKKQALLQLNQTLKSDGRLIIAHVSSRNQITHHHKTLRPLIKDILPEEKEMKLLLKNAGFIAIQIKDEPNYYLCRARKSRQCTGKL